MKTLFFLFTLFGYTFCYSQKIKPTHVFFRTINDKIEIFYDLPRNSDTLEVKIYFRKKSDPHTNYLLRRVKGKVGIGRFSGKKQKAIWSYKKEPPYLFTGSGFYYEVVVKRISRISRN